MTERLNDVQKDTINSCYKAASKEIKNLPKEEQLQIRKTIDDFCKNLTDGSTRRIQLQKISAEIGKVRDPYAVDPHIAIEPAVTPHRAIPEAAKTRR